MSKFTVRRPNFVDGMLLIAEDLSLEQKYLNRRLRQIALRDGWGVVEGLGVTDDGKGNLAISPGSAIDAQGCEIVLDESPEGGVPAKTGVLCIRRGDPKPLTASDVARMACTSSNAGLVVRYVEQAEVEIRQWRDLVSDLEKGWVPLVRIEADAKITIPPVQRLTTISGLSWSHGESQGPSEWWIKFSAPVAKAPSQALEIRIRSGGGTEKIIAAALEPDALGIQHYFKIDLAQQKKAKRETETIFIRLACDFILDWKGDPVSGAHLAGRLPSGNGIAGGLFESWFTISEQAT